MTSKDVDKETLDELEDDCDLYHSDADIGSEKWDWMTERAYAVLPSLIAATRELATLREQSRWRRCGDGITIEVNQGKQRVNRVDIRNIAEGVYIITADLVAKRADFLCMEEEGSLAVLFYNSDETLHADDSASENTALTIRGLPVDMRVEAHVSKYTFQALVIARSHFSAEADVQWFDSDPNPATPPAGTRAALVPPPAGTSEETR